MKALKYLPLPEKKSGAVGHVIGVANGTLGPQGRLQSEAGQEWSNGMTYYFGTGWSKYDVPNQQVWEALLQSYADNLRQPLVVEVK